MEKKLFAWMKILQIKCKCKIYEIETQPNIFGYTVWIWSPIFVNFFAIENLLQSQNYIDCTSSKEFSNRPQNVVTIQIKGQI